MKPPVALPVWAEQACDEHKTGRRVEYESRMTRLISSSLVGILFLFVIGLLQAHGEFAAAHVLGFTIYYGVTSILAVVLIGSIFRRWLTSMDLIRSRRILLISSLVSFVVLILARNYHSSDDLVQTLAWLSAIVISLAYYAYKIAARH